MSSLHLALYSFGSSHTQTGSSSMLELLETLGNSDLYLPSLSQDAIKTEYLLRSETFRIRKLIK